MPNKTRPYVICHMMSTIEGKITSGDGTDILSDDYFDLYTKTEDLLPHHTGWLLGRVTIQMFAAKEPTVLSLASNEITPGDYIAPHSGKHYLFGVDTKGILRWDKNSIKLSNVPDPLHLVIVTTTSTPRDYLHYLQDNRISYLVAGDTEIDFETLFATMKEKLGVETLLLEGGALLNGSVMAANAVDEISLLITPTIINQTHAPSVFERDKKEPINLRHYALASVKQMEKDTVWVRYKKLS